MAAAGTGGGGGAQQRWPVSSGEAEQLGSGRSPGHAALRARACAVAAAQDVLRSNLLRNTLKARLLAQWHGIGPVPPAESVCMLPSCELREFDPGELLVVGEMHGCARGWAQRKPDVLHKPTLAVELLPVAHRVANAATAEEAWQRALSLAEGVKLKAPKVEVLKACEGDSTVIYGRHSRTLRVHDGHAKGWAGHLSFGQFENGHAESRARMCPRSTMDNIEMVRSVFISLAPMPILLQRPRAQLIRECSTVEHSDRQRGDTVSAFRFAKMGIAALLVRTDILMCVSVCRYRGKLVIPMCMRSTTPPCVLVYTWDEDYIASEALVPYAALDTEEWQRVGMLEVVATGLDNLCVHVLLYSMMCKIWYNLYQCYIYKRL